MITFDEFNHWLASRGIDTVTAEDSLIIFDHWAILNDKWQEYSSHMTEAIMNIEDVVQED
jgi:hypothetical protein